MKKFAMCALLVALPALCANKAAPKTTRPNAWPVETLSGRITMVNPARKLLVIENPNHVPFDLVVTNKTHIRSGDQTLSLESLTSDQNKNVTVQFVPERGGDVARSVQVTG